MSEIVVRRLNDKGIKEFLFYVEGGGIGQTPTYLLDSDEHSEPLPQTWKIDTSWTFADRFDFARRIWPVLKDKWQPELEWDAGFWTWLALVYFDQFRKPIGKKLSRREHYVFDKSYLLHYRHCAAMPVKLFRDFGEDARLFLTDSMDSMGEMLEQCMSRQYLMRSSTFVQAVRALYLDPKTMKIKPGAAGKVVRQRNSKGKWLKGGAGSIRRFALEIHRLNLTYNLERMDPDELVNLLGREYDRFKPEDDPSTEQAAA